MTRGQMCTFDSPSFDFHPQHENHHENGVPMGRPNATQHQSKIGEQGSHYGIIWNNYCAGGLSIGAAPMAKSVPTQK